MHVKIFNVNLFAFRKDFQAAIRPSASLQLSIREYLFLNPSLVTFEYEFTFWN